MRRTYVLLFVLLCGCSAALAGVLPSSQPPAAPGGSLEPGTASVRSSNPAIVTVPAETEADIQLLSGIHSSVSHVGDPFAAQLMHPIRVNGHVVLPAGSVIDGRITYIRPAGRLRRSAELSLRFELVTLPNGETQPISALLTTMDAMPQTHTLVDSEGVLKGTNAGTWRRLTGGLLGLGAASALGTQIAGAAALGITLPVGGSAVLGYSYLIPKGSDVHLPPDTQMRIRLRQPITFRVSW